MKLISTDFSNLGKKTIFDFGDAEAVDELLKVRKSTRERITRDFFDIADTPVRFNWMRDLAVILQSVDPNAKKLFNAADKEIDKYFKHRDEMADKGVIID